MFRILGYVSKNDGMNIPIRDVSVSEMKDKRLYPAVSLSDFCRIAAWFFLIVCCNLSCLYGQTFQNHIRPILEDACHGCHSGDDPAGDLDLARFETNESVLLAFEVWDRVNQVLADRKMPPPDESPLSDGQREQVLTWYRQTFVNSIKAKPGVFRPRRLAAIEYRNTLRSLFGFDLEVSVMEAEQTLTEKSLVLKLLPTDPPGESGFTNDTHRNPLSSHTWEQYSYLVDVALEQLFAAPRRKRLETLAGKIDDLFERKHAVLLVRNMLPRIARRDISEQEMSRFVGRLEDLEDYELAAKRELKSALMGPTFIYRGLRMPRIEDAEQAVDGFELAERLSYFLWADMPDERLLDMARDGSLADESKLRLEVERMLDSPKARSLATDFATQWLNLGEIEHVSNNPPMMLAYKSQPIDFFHYLIAADRPLLELIDSKSAFVSPLTKKFYGSDAGRLPKYRKPKGIEIEIVPNSRLELQSASWRGGILTMPGVLAMNRGPILRGVWMVERILGQHLPDPPADVGQVEANIPGQNLSFRERFELHRENESCALCHDRIDPLGFALDGYDDKGAFRLKNESRNSKKSSRKRKQKQPTQTHFDTRGQLPSGESFSGAQELKQILITSHRDVVIRNIVQRTLSYALCRKLQIYDRPTVESIVTEMTESNGSWRDLIHKIVTSLPFRRTYVPAKNHRSEPHELEN